MNVYNSFNMLSGVADDAWYLEGATVVGGVISLEAGGRAEVDLYETNREVLFHSSFIRNIVEFLGGETSLLDSKVVVILEATYVAKEGEEVEKDLISIYINKDSIKLDSICINTSEVELKGKAISRLKVRIINRGSLGVEIKRIGLYASQDVAPTQIADILKEEVIAGDVIQATSSFTATMFTQYLRTNVFSLEAINSLGGGVVNYLTAQDYELGFYSAELSSSEKEHFKVSIKVEDKLEDIYFWYAVIEGENAHKYVCTVDPRDKYPNISDEDREKFKFMVWKTDSLKKKLSIEFMDVDDGDGGTTTTPIFILGEGTGVGNNGQMLIYKDHKGGYIKYITRDGRERGLVADESGIYLVGVLIRLEYAKRYRNGLRAKFQGDPTPYDLKFSTDEQGDFDGIWINNKDFISSPYIDKLLP